MKSKLYWLWPLTISFAEVAIIVACAHRFGAIVIFSIFVATALIGLLIQLIRWHHRFRDESNETGELSKRMRARADNSKNWTDMPEFDRWSELMRSLSSFWTGVALFFLPACRLFTQHGDAP